MCQVLQRIYKYGGQPFVRDYLEKNHVSTFTSTFGEKTGKAMMSSFAGRFVLPCVCSYAVIVAHKLVLVLSVSERSSSFPSTS